MVLFRGAACAAQRLAKRQIGLGVGDVRQDLAFVGRAGPMTPARHAGNEKAGLANALIYRSGSRAATSRRPRRKAKRCAVSPRALATDGSAPCCNRSTTRSTLPATAANIKGVEPSWHARALTSRPRRSNSAANALCRLAARLAGETGADANSCSALVPASVFSRGSAPLCSKNSALSSRPAPKAASSAVPPVWSRGASGRAPASRSNPNSEAPCRFVWNATASLDRGGGAERVSGQVVQP
jgi:hypothetical protein